MTEQPIETAGRARPLVVAGVVVLAVIVLALAVALGLRDRLLPGAIGAAARGAGYQVALGSLHTTFGSADARDVRVTNLAGEPVFEAQRVDVDFSLRDLLPGGKRRFGLKAVDVAGPHVTLIRHADGTYNITIPAPSAQAARPNTTPIDVRLRVRDGSADLVNGYTSPRRPTRDHVAGLTVDAVLTPVAVSHYTIGATLQENGAKYPLAGKGTFDDARGFEIQHFAAARLPIANLANLGLPNRALVVNSGALVGIDGHYVGLLGHDGALHFHLNVHASLADGRVTVANLDRPIRDAHGSVILYEDGASVPGLDATLAGVPIHLNGGVYDFAKPQVRFGIHAAGELHALRAISAQIAKLPVTGRLTLGALAEGDAASPIVFARFRSPHIAYGAFTFDRADGLAAVSGQELDALSTDVAYGPVTLGARGMISLQKHVGTTAFATFHTAASALPYAVNLIPGMQLQGSAVIHGVDAKIATRGALVGSGNGDRLDAPFSFDVDGTGSIGPIALERADGASLYARAHVDRRTNTTVAIADIHGLSLSAGHAALPGFDAPAIPRVPGTLDATVAAVAAGSTVTALNGSIHGYGPWGDLRADAGGAASGIAANGRFTGSFDRLAALTGPLGARGEIDAPFTVLSDGTRTTAQIDGARFTGASFHGVPFESVSATVGVRPRAIDVYAATLRVAQHDITAHGSFGNGGELEVTAGDVDLAAFRAAGLPLRDGRATAVADLGGTFAQPNGRLRLALTGAHYGSAAVDADAHAHYGGDTVTLDDATVGFGGTYANASGTVAGVSERHVAPRYDLHATVRDGDIATLAGTVKNPLRYPAGTLDADVHVTGAGSSPALHGALQIPEGSINGLAFRAARVQLDGDAARLMASAGHVSVGSTALDFSADVAKTRQAFALRADHVDLADFNDYFDDADVFAGTGHVALAGVAGADTVAATSDVALRGVRVRRFAVGTTNVALRTAGTTVRTNANVTGANGTFALAGTVALPASKPLRDTLHRAYVDEHVTIAGVALGNVLPAAGIAVPLVGTASGAIAVRGRYPALALATNASLADGVAGRIPIERFTIAATAANGRGRVTDVSLVTSALTASGSGTFGLRPADAFDLAAHIVSPDLNALGVLATGKAPGIKGSYDGTVHLTGTLAKPQLASTNDLRGLAYDGVTIPDVRAEVDANKQIVFVRNGAVTLTKGSIAFDGQYPFARGAAAPIAFDVAPRGVDLAPYSKLLPDGGALGGVVDGNVALGGTLARPRLAGNLDLAKGSFRSNDLKSPLTAMTLQLAFAGTQVRIAKLHAHATPGNIDGTGVVNVGDLRDPAKALAANLDVKLANVFLAAPKFYSGFIDGDVTVVKAPAQRATVGGALTFASARVPYAAFLPGPAPATAATSAPPDVAFNLGITIGKDVRIQQGPVDVGASGTATLGGTLAKPTLDGVFTANDGTLAFYRTFTLQPGATVRFDPSDGVIPNVDITATTYVPDPSTNVILTITGPATNLNLAFASQPEYDKTQILGLLVNAQAFGAVAGVPQSSRVATSGGPSPITGVTEGYINSAFNQQFLSPLGQKLGSSLGLSDLQIGYGLGGEVSAAARRVIGKNLALNYGETFGGSTPRTTLGLSIGGATTSINLTAFSSPGSTQSFGAGTPFLQSGFLQNGPINYTLQAAEPPTGTSGFIFTYVRKFP